MKRSLLHDLFPVTCADRRHFEIEEKIKTFKFRGVEEKIIDRRVLSCSDEGLLEAWRFHSDEQIRALIAESDIDDWSLRPPRWMNSHGVVHPKDHYPGGDPVCTREEIRSIRLRVLELRRRLRDGQ